MTVSRRATLSVRTVALAYLTLLLLFPVWVVFYRTFEHGIAPAWDAVSAPYCRSARA